MTQMLDTARHNSASNVRTYQKDAATRWELNNLTIDPTANVVGPFRSRHLSQQPYGAIATSSTPFQKPLPELVQWWYNDCLGMKGKPFDMPVSILENVVLVRRDPTGPISNLDDLAQLLSTHISSQEIVKTLMAKITAVTHVHSSRVNADLLGQLEALKISNLPTAAPLPVLREVRATREQPIKSTPKTGTLSLVIPSFRCTTTLDKLRICTSVRTEFLLGPAKGHLKMLLPAPKRWIIRNMGMLHCLETCCGKSEQRFVEIYGTNVSIGKKNWICKCGWDDLDV